LTEIHLPDRAPHEPYAAQAGVYVVPLQTPTLPPATHTNCVLIGGPNEVVVVDPASPYSHEQERLVQVLEERGASVRAIWLTHHHLDHVGGANALREALDVPVLGHPATAERLTGQVRLDGALYEGDVEDVGGVPIEILHTPGHARGHLAFRHPQSRLVVAGDLVAGQGTIVIDPPEGDMADYLATLGRLIQEGVGAMVPSHGPLILDGEAKLLEYIAHRLAREEQIAAALAPRPAKALDLVPGLYPEIPVMFHPLAARQVLAHLLKLEAEGTVDRPDGSTGVPGAPVYMAFGGSSAPECAFRWIGPAG
jgi:glyoxylase-like metal-dependent hydrolase (beta-lactamase superfamily II)